MYKPIILYVVGMIIGFLSGIIIPIYEFKTHEFSLVNLIILTALEIVWYIFFDLFIKEK